MQNYVFCSQFFLEPKHIFEPVSSNMKKRTFSAKDSETLQYFQNYSKLIFFLFPIFPHTYMTHSAESPDISKSLSF